MNLSHLFAPFNPPETNLVERLRYWSEAQPTETSFYFLSDREEETRLTYEQLDREARSLAAHLESKGMRGERALLFYPQGLDFVVAFFGCLYAGVTAVPAYPPRRNRHMGRLDAISEDSQASIVLTVKDVERRSRRIIEDAPHLKNIEWLATDRISTDMSDQWDGNGVDEQSMAVLQYTSGSTGTPKGVMLSHANLMHNCSLITYGFDPSRTGVGLTWLPTYHDMGLVGGVLKPVYFGRPNVLMSPMAFLQKPIRWLRGISRYGVCISGGPNFAYALCNEKISEEECEGLDLSAWDVAFNGAEPVRAETLKTFTEKFSPYGFRAEAHYPCYGMAETTLIVTGGPKYAQPVIQAFNTSSLEGHEVVKVVEENGETKPLVGCGEVLPDMKIVIADPATRKQLPDDDVGEIWVKGPSVAQGYWNRPDETYNSFNVELAGTDEVGFLRTGDMGFMHDGQLFVAGRSKDLIIIRGRNLYPHDIEQTVEKAHEAVRSLGSAAFSIEEDDEEQLVIALEIERQYNNADLDEVIAAVRTAVLEQLEVAAHTVILLKAGKLPKTSSGKTQRSACREQYLAGHLDVLKRWSLSSFTPSGAGNEAESTVSGTAASSQSAKAIQQWLAARIAERMSTEPEAVGIHEPFASFGLDSVALVGISGEMEDWLGQEVSPTLLFSYPTIAALSEYLATEHDLGPQTGESLKAEEHEPIAVVGVGCRFPGAADPNEFWKLLRDGLDAVGDLPDGRWDADEFYDDDPEAVGKTYTNKGGYLADVDQFDPQFFGMSPREAESLDPQQRLLMEVCWETLEDAAQPATRLENSDTGIFVGISNSDYARLQNRLGSLKDIDAHSGTGSLNSIAAGRLAYFLGLHGPCMSVDTACSSSLVAVHLAMQSLRNGECRAALAGGVNLVLDPSSLIALSAMRALSPAGRCKTFDAGADGYVRGEGCGIVMLKRLSDAVEDGDRVLALVRGSAINHDGRSNGLTAPHGPSQQMLLQDALRDAGVEPNQVSYIEAHGTGTELGDPIEVQALDKVFSNGRNETTPLLLGAVKTNIGHLESAAGIAGFIKGVLALRHSQLPPLLHFENPNPLIAWDRMPVQVATELTPWAPLEGRRIMGVSSFGFSGTNAHVVLEQAPEPKRAEAEVERPQHLLALSAREPNALKALAERYCEALENTEDSLADVCFTAATGRTHLPHRVAVVAADIESTRAKLDAQRRGQFAAGVHEATLPTETEPKIALLFTGQGSQFVGMGRTLYETQPTFRRSLDECNQILADQLEPSLLSVIYAEQDDRSTLDQTEFTQPALFAIEYSLWQLWKSWGIEPTAVFGHSVGEYAAACAAGVFSLEDGLRLIATRGRLMQNLPHGGEMFAISANEATVAAALETASDAVSLAALNSPEQTVISGSSAGVRSVVQKLQAGGIRCAPLTVSHAFHSSLMDPMLDEFEQACREVSFSSPQLQLVSDVHGQVVSDEIASAEFWRKQIRQPVRFTDAMATLDGIGCNIFLEIGPKPVLTALGRQCIVGADHLWLSSLRSGKDDWSQMLESVAELYVNGVDIDWRGFDADYGRRKVSLPTYPFQRKRYWFEGSGEAEVRATAAVSQKAESLDAFYEIQWQPTSRLDQELLRRPAEFLPEPVELAERVAPEVQRLRSQLSLKRNQAFEDELERLSAAYVRAAFKNLDWQPVAGEQFTTESLAKHLNVVDQHDRLFRRMLEILSEEGVLEKAGEQWQVSAEAPPEPDPAMIWSIAAPQYPDCDAELDLLKQCGENLAGVLTGSTDPLQVLFPTGSAEMVENLYRQSPFARTLNTLVEESLAQAIEDLPAGRTVKILEIGAGTGGTTAQLLPRLPAERTEYVFTDVSEIFTRAAEKKFPAFPFVRYRVLDIESDPREQGLADEQFDIVIAANVLHATQDLQQTIDHVHQLLAPQGILLLLEGTRKQRWLDLIFGLTEGWWRFSDSSLRADHALLSQSQWTDLIGNSGFSASLPLPGTIHDGDREVIPPQSVIVSQKGAVAHAASVPANSKAQAKSVPAATSAGLPRDSELPPEDENARESILIFSDRGGVGESLAGALRDRGHECLLAFNGKNGAQIDETHVEVEADSPDAILEVFENCRESYFAAERVVYLWGLDSADVDELTVDSLATADVAGCHGALSAVQALVKSGLSGDSKFWIATRGAQPVADDRQVSGLSQSPLWGLGRVVSEELPVLWGGLVDLDPQKSNEQQASLLASEILESDDEDQIAYRNDQRFSARLVPRTSNTLSQPIRWRVDGSYLVSGGLGELGLRVARWMAERGARTIVLFGRSDFPARAHWDAVAAEDERRAQQIEEIRRIEALGARVRIASVDVANEQQLSTLFDGLAQEGLPPIRGVVHAAGLAEAQTLLELDHEQLARVMRAKTLGTWLLHKLLGHQRLDFFVSFSSGAALLGSPLLGSYAAANSFLDAISHHRKLTGQPALSVNWGFWAELGMVARSQREIGRGFAPQGMQSFTPEQGLAAMQKLLEEKATQTTFMPVDWNEWAKFHPRASRAPLLRQVLASSPAEEAVDLSDVEETTLTRDQLLAEPADRQPEMVQNFLCGQLSKVLRIPVEELDVEQPLNNLGIDSLMAVELRNHVQAKLGVVIPVAQLLQDPSISQLSQSLLELLDSDRAAEKTEAGPASDQADVAAEDASTKMPESPTLDEAMAQVEGMSEEEVDRMLNDMLN